MSTPMHDHIVKSYDDEQRRLLNETLRMGEMAAAQLEAALDVVQRRDDKAAERIIANDEAIDALEHEISHDVMKLALRGPMARDLREILAAIRIAADIERVGDYAANVAKRSTALNLAPPLPHIGGLHALGTLAVKQLRDVLAAYRDGDVEVAQRVRGLPGLAGHGVEEQGGRGIYHTVPHSGYVADRGDAHPALQDAKHLPGCIAQTHLPVNGIKYRW